MSATGATRDVRSHELDAPPWMRVETTLMAVARLVREAYDARFAAIDLNLTQASVLAYVADYGPVIQTRIADHLGNGRAATGVTIDRLQIRGLVERRPDPVDRRVWLIDLTGAGRDLITKISEVDESLRTELRNGITREERQALNHVLGRLGHNLHEAINTASSTTTTTSTHSSEGTSHD
jgi:MarR family transcriptional regulator, transcriptional regulator for hemolysin